MMDDAGTTFIGGFAPGSPNVIENSYAKLDCSKTTVSGSGSTLTVTWSVSFKLAFAGTKHMYVSVRDPDVSIPWAALGTWTIINQLP
jgi:hypothetical protein